nr:MAG TPA: hypothetical protein [Caudoviricetes sp.]
MYSSLFNIHFILYFKKNNYNMYPLYWKTNKGGIFMRYNYKKKAIELFYPGK